MRYLKTIPIEQQIMKDFFTNLKVLRPHLKFKFNALARHIAEI